MAPSQEPSAPGEEQYYDIHSYRQDAPDPNEAESSDDYYNEEVEEITKSKEIDAMLEIDKPPAEPTLELPPNFLDGPPPNLTKSMVEFKELLPEFGTMWAMVLDGVLSVEECKQLVAVAESTAQWERALVNIGGGRQAFYEDVRKCGRIIIDDRDLAARIWARIEAEVPDICRLEKWPEVTGNGPTKRNEVWKMTRLNERMRFLKYIGGEYFKAHCDGLYETPDMLERSYFTLHLYLNDAGEGEEPLVGGETAFFGYDMHRTLKVVPKAGRVLLFQQRGLIHSGEDVVSGTKYTMRTDIMYQKEEQVEE